MNIIFPMKLISLHPIYIVVYKLSGGYFCKLVCVCVWEADRQSEWERDGGWFVFPLCYWLRRRGSERPSEAGSGVEVRQYTHAVLQGFGQTVHSCGGAQAKSLRWMWVNMSAQGGETWHVLPWSTTPRAPVFRPSNCVKYCICKPWRATEVSRQAFTFSTLWLICTFF